MKCFHFQSERISVFICLFICLFILYAFFNQHTKMQPDFAGCILIPESKSTTSFQLEKQRSRLPTGYTRFDQSVRSSSTKTRGCIHQSLLLVYSSTAFSNVINPQPHSYEYSFPKIDLIRISENGIVPVFAKNEH